MNKKEKRYVLKKDIVVPAGTVFESICGRRSSYIDKCFSTLIGLTDDTSGELIYGIDELDEKMNDWFEEVCE